MNAEQLIQDHPDFYRLGTGKIARCVEVTEQVIQHTRRTARVKAIDQLRPNESEAVKKYRAETYRRLTKAPFSEMLSKVTRILHESGINTESVSEGLGKWLKRKPFRNMRQRIDIWDYWYKCICVEGLEDPNAVLIAFPYSINNRHVPPILPEEDGGTDKTKPVGIRPLLVSSGEQIDLPLWYDVFAWKGGKRKLSEDTTADFYFIVDDVNFYTYEPVLSKDAKNKISYELRLWYPHNTGMEDEDGFERILPISIMPGILTKSESGDFQYNETLIHGAIEFFDEFTARFSDSSLITTRFGHPKEIINDEISCSVCQGKGQVQYKGKTGVPAHRKCGHCHGTRLEPDIGPAGRLHRKSKGLDKGNNRPLIEYPTLPVDVLKYAYEQAFDILEKAQERMGLSLLSKFSESGKAKELRLEPSEDFLNSFATGFFKESMESFLFHVECLLQIDPKNRKRPVVKLPVSYKIKDYDHLTDRAKNTFPAMRQTMQLEAIDRHFKSDPFIAQVYGWAYCYCPTLQIAGENIDTFIDNAIYDRQEIRKAHYMPTVIKEFLKIGDTTRTQAQFIAFADAFLEDKIVEVTEIRDANGEIAADGEQQVGTLGQLNTKLLESVGGVNGIVDISRAVAKGEMTKKAGINLVIQLYGIPRNIAETLIDVPEEKIEQALNDPTRNTQSEGGTT